MHTSTTRRDKRRDAQKRTRGRRVLAILTAAGITSTFLLGTTSTAMASDAPVDGENVSATQVEAPSPEEVTPPVVEEAPVVEASAPEPVAAPPEPAPVVDPPKPEAPVAPAPVQDDTSSRAASAPEPTIDSNEQAVATSTHEADKSDKGGDKGTKPKQFDWNWQYAAPTCDGLTVVYPKHIPEGSDHKDVNIRVKDLVSGTVKTFNFHDSNFVTSGKTVTYQVTTHPSWPGWTHFEIQWTQVHGTNFHWEGSVVCGEKPGTEPPPCVDKATWSYTFDGVGSGTVSVTAKNAKQGDELCDALAIRATTYEYDRPASGTPSWPQTLFGFSDYLVDTIGTHPYAAPALDVCRQHDIYAEFLSDGGFEALTVAENLYGPSNPFEPQFLHQALAGKGPNPTWSITSSDGCNQPPEPEVVTGPATFQTLSCEEGSKNWAEAEAVPGGVWVFTDEFGSTYRAPMGEGYAGGLPGDLVYGKITVTLEQGDTTDYVVTPWSGEWMVIDAELLDCNPEEPPLAPGDIGATCVGDVPWLAYDVALPDGYPLPSDTPLTITFVHPTDASQNYTVTNLLLRGKVLWPGAWDGSDGKAKQWPGWVLNADGSYVETAGNYRWTREGVTVLFQVNPEYTTVVHYPADDALCANPPEGEVPPPTNPPTDKPTPPTTPTNNPNPPVNSGAPKPPTSTVVVVKPKPPATLAQTGVNGIALMGASAIALLLVGGVTLLVVRRPRRADEQ